MRSDELEATLGERLRSLRIAQRLTQVELAERANVSLGALKHLETGTGATTATLAKVVRALGQEGWVEALGPGPAVAFNPLALLEAQEQEQRRGPRRVRARRADRPREVAP